MRRGVWDWLTGSGCCLFWLPRFDLFCERAKKATFHSQTCQLNFLPLLRAECYCEVPLGAVRARRDISVTAGVCVSAWPCVCLPHSARFSSQLLCKKLCLVPCVCGCVCVLEGCWPCWTPLMKHCHSVDILWNATEIMQFWTRAYYDYCWMFKVKQVKSASEYSLASWF